MSAIFSPSEIEAFFEGTTHEPCSAARDLQQVQWNSGTKFCNSELLFLAHLRKDLCA